MCCVGGPLGHAGGRGSEAQLETWERQGQAVHQKNAARAAHGGVWHGRKMAGAGSAQRAVSARNKRKLSPRACVGIVGEAWKACLPAGNGNKKAMFQLVQCGSSRHKEKKHESGTPCKGRLETNGHWKCCNTN